MKARRVHRMEEPIDPFIQEAEETLESLTRAYGPNSLPVAEALEHYAKRGRADGMHRLAAANYEARARVILSQHGAPIVRISADAFLHVKDMFNGGGFQLTLIWLAKLLKGDARLWCQGKLWQGRALLWLFLLFVFIKHLQRPEYQSIFKPLDLGVHELGHYLFAPLGEFMQVAGGSILQCLMPIIGMILFLRQRDYFAISVAFGWLAVNLYDVALYAGDARTQALVLVSPSAAFGGGDIIHDWNYLLSKTGLIRCDHVIAFMLSTSASLCMIICLGSGFWLLWNMFQWRAGSGSSKSGVPGA